MHATQDFIDLDEELAEIPYQRIRNAHPPRSKDRKRPGNLDKISPQLSPDSGEQATRLTWMPTARRTAVPGIRRSKRIINLHSRQIFAIV